MRRGGEVFVEMIKVSSIDLNVLAELVAKINEVDLLIKRSAYRAQDPIS